MEPPYAVPGTSARQACRRWKLSTLLIGATLVARPACGVKQQGTSTAAPSPYCKGKLDIERSSVCGKDEMWDAKSLCAFSSYLKRNCPVRCQTCTTLNSTSDASPQLSVLPMEYWALESGPDASSDIREYEVAWSKMERLYDEATARAQLHAAVVFYPNEANREASVLLHVYKRFLTLRTQLLGKGWTNILMADEFLIEQGVLAGGLNRSAFDWSTVGTNVKWRKYIDGPTVFATLTPPTALGEAPQQPLAPRARRTPVEETTKETSGHIRPSLPSHPPTTSAVHAQVNPAETIATKTAVSPSVTTTTTSTAECSQFRTSQFACELAFSGDGRCIWNGAADLSMRCATAPAQVHVDRANYYNRVIMFDLRDSWDTPVGFKPGSFQNCTTGLYGEPKGPTSEPDGTPRLGINDAEFWRLKLRASGIPLPRDRVGQSTDKDGKPEWNTLPSSVILVCSPKVLVKCTAAAATLSSRAVGYTLKSSTDYIASFAQSETPQLVTILNVYGSAATAAISDLNVMVAVASHDMLQGAFMEIQCTYVNVSAAIAASAQALASRALVSATTTTATAAATTTTTNGNATVTPTTAATSSTTTTTTTKAATAAAPPHSSLLDSGLVCSEAFVAGNSHLIGGQQTIEDLNVLLEGTPPPTGLLTVDSGGWVKLDTAEGPISEGRPSTCDGILDAIYELLDAYAGKTGTSNPLARGDLWCSSTYISVSGSVAYCDRTVAALNAIISEMTTPTPTPLRPSTSAKHIPTTTAMTAPPTMSSPNDIVVYDMRHYDEGSSAGWNNWLANCVINVPEVASYVDGTTVDLSEQALHFFVTQLLAHQNVSLNPADRVFVVLLCDRANYNNLRCEDTAKAIEQYFGFDVQWTWAFNSHVPLTGMNRSTVGVIEFPGDGFPDVSKMTELTVEALCTVDPKKISTTTAAAATTATATPPLPALSRCDPRHDLCDNAKGWFCDHEEYACQHAAAPTSSHDRNGNGNSLGAVDTTSTTTRSSRGSHSTAAPMATPTKSSVPSDDGKPKKKTKGLSVQAKLAYYCSSGLGVGIFLAGIFLIFRQRTELRNRRRRGDNGDGGDVINAVRNRAYAPLPVHDLSGEDTSDLDYSTNDETEDDIQLLEYLGDFNLRRADESRLGGINLNQD